MNKDKDFYTIDDEKIGSLHIEADPDTDPKFAPSNPLDPVADSYADPDFKREEARKNAKHKNVLFFHKALPIITVILLLMLASVVFVILPFSEIELEFDSVLSFMQEYNRAFVASTNTIFIALATIIVSDLLRRFYGYIKKNIQDSDVF
ncbi:MAG: hypothetical protein FWC70_08230 [Defluviitaleaceae bacterium]|nr:hypothetical protein [Defluviitaleaceae bacterium]